MRARRALGTSFVNPLHETESDAGRFVPYAIAAFVPGFYAGQWVLNKRMGVSMNREVLGNVQRIVKVMFFAALAAAFVWRANTYSDPRGFTGVPQALLCLTGLLFGIIAFCIGLGYGASDAETE
jgi:hypothetical protein